MEFAGYCIKMKKLKNVERIKRRPRMGRVQGGARAAFATPSWGPARMLLHLQNARFKKFAQIYIFPP